MHSSRIVTGSTILAVSLAVFVCLIVSNARAQQAQRAQAKQEVPNNLAPHPAPEQPIPYSHKTHLAFPASSTCMTCHANIAKDKPSIMKLAEFNQSGQPIPWVRVYQVTSGVTWSHRRHLQAGMQCIMCHGDVSQLDAMQQTTSVTAMASCIDCHRARNASTACVTCHTWPSDSPSNKPAGNAKKSKHRSDLEKPTAPVGWCWYLRWN
jgi:hypothetical protein